MRTVLITGVQGVGKSTLTRLAARALGLEGWDYADLMVRVEPSIRHKDDLQFIAWNDRVQVYRKVDELLAELLGLKRSVHHLLLLALFQVPLLEF